MIFVVPGGTSMAGKKLGKVDVAQILEDFLQGKGNRWAWDDFTQGGSLEDGHLEQVRRHCARLSQEFPPENPKEYCNEQGRDVIRRYITELRSP
jgi:hypothetical protein